MSDDRCARPALRIAVTGAAGFLGWHLRCYLHAVGGHAVNAIDRVTFGEPKSLQAALRDCDAVMHLAGLNRAEERQILRDNPQLARILVDACDAVGTKPHLVFAGSTHQLRDSAYGRSKREAAAVLERWADRNGAGFTNVVFPHLFGEGGRPFYNSVIATFCHQLACGQAPTIAEDGELELVHAQRASEVLLDAVLTPRLGELRVTGDRMLVSQALVRLQSLAEQYRAQLIPELAGALDLELFNTYRHCLFPNAYPVRPTLRSDARGDLYEAVRTLHGGQAFISCTHPGVTRGNHFHRHKIERFLVVRGRATIRVRRLLAGDVHAFDVSGAAPGWIDMPTLHTHNITNAGDGELITLFWANEIFDPARPDTYSERV